MMLLSAGSRSKIVAHTLHRRFHLVEPTWGRPARSMSSLPPLGMVAD
jgi:hypothetical protein